MKEIETTPPDRPPMAVDALENLLRHYRASGKPWPDMMPGQVETAARWWMENQAPGQRYESPVRMRKSWKTPYPDRLVATLRKFLTSSEELQRLVIAAVEDAIWWRGEDLYFFVMVIEEFERMREIGVDEYRKESLLRVKNLDLSITT